MTYKEKVYYFNFFLCKKNLCFVLFCFQNGPRTEFLTLEGKSKKYDSGKTAVLKALSILDNFDRKMLNEAFGGWQFLYNRLP